MVCALGVDAKASTSFRTPGIRVYCVNCVQVVFPVRVAGFVLIDRFA